MLLRNLAESPPEEITDVLGNWQSPKKALLGAFREVLRKMTGSKDVDMDEQFVSESGRVLSRHQMGLFMWKEGADIERDGDGFIVNGEEYTPCRDR